MRDSSYSEASLLVRVINNSVENLNSNISHIFLEKTQLHLIRTSKFQLEILVMKGFCLSPVSLFPLFLFPSSINYLSMDKV